MKWSFLILLKFKDLLQQNKGYKCNLLIFDAFVTYSKFVNKYIRAKFLDV